MPTTRQQAEHTLRLGEYVPDFPNWQTSRASRIQEAGLDAWLDYRENGQPDQGLVVVRAKRVLGGRVLKSSDCSAMTD